MELSDWLNNAKTPTTWTEFGALYDAALTAGYSIQLGCVTPNSDDPVYWCALWHDAMSAVFGSPPDARADDLGTLFDALADALRLAYKQPDPAADPAAEDPRAAYNDGVARERFDE